MLRRLRIFISFFFFFHKIYIILEWDFFFFSLLRTEMLIYLDRFFFSILRVVGVIRINVIFYRVYYIENGKFNLRFLILVFLFILRIFFFILSPRIVRIFLGWDGLGLVSYLLVNFYGNSRRLNSGILTVLSNRIGDVFILIGIFFSVCIGGWKFLFWERSDIRLIFILARFTKSAQLPFSRWLPFAIAAPTPVSSLVHSSTLVTAGVFFLFRLFDLILTINAYLVFCRGALTILCSRICGVFESDLKKVIALSTLRQLGIIMVILGLGFKEFCFFHLIIHALFKSRLFIRIGCKIHEYCDFQDSRIVRRGWKNQERDFFFGLTNLALVGFPFLSGFFSKDLRLEFIFSGNLNFFFSLLLLLSISLTACYSVKFVLLGRLNFTNFFVTPKYNLVSEKVFFRLRGLLLLRAWFGFFYFANLLDSHRVMELSVFIKFRIIAFLYYLYLFSNRHVLLKNMLLSKFARISRALFFLAELTTFFKVYLSEFIWAFKFIDMGYLDLLKCTTVQLNLGKLSLYVEFGFLTRFFLFLSIFLHGLVYF